MYVTLPTMYIFVTALPVMYTMLPATQIALSVMYIPRCGHLDCITGHVYRATGHLDCITGHVYRATGHLNYIACHLYRIISRLDYAACHVYRATGHLDNVAGYAITLAVMCSMLTADYCLTRLLSCILASTLLQMKYLTVFKFPSLNPPVPLSVLT